MGLCILWSCELMENHLRKIYLVSKRHKAIFQMFLVTWFRPYRLDDQIAGEWNSVQAYQIEKIECFDHEKHQILIEAVAKTIHWLCVQCHLLSITLSFHGWSDMRDYLWWRRHLLAFYTGNGKTLRGKLQGKINYIRQRRKSAILIRRGKQRR